jgi:plasmid stabilization system protein ParE
LTRYQVILTPTARQHALEITEWIADRSPANAARWYVGLESAVNSLDFMPSRRARALESDYLGEELRQYVYGSYRIIFRIEEEAAIVRVLYVRHAPRRAIGEPADDSDDD